MDQIWAEALFRYREGEVLFLRGDLAEQAASEQTEALESDEREGLVRDYLEKKLPENWRNMDLPARREFLRGGITAPAQLRERDRICTFEIWCECFNKDESMLKKADSYEINALLARIEGWKKYEGNRDGKMRFPLYGVQRAFMREGISLEADSLQAG